MASRALGNSIIITIIITFSFSIFFLMFFLGLLAHLSMRKNITFFLLHLIIIIKRFFNFLLLLAERVLPDFPYFFLLPICFLIASSKEFLQIFFLYINILLWNCSIYKTLHSSAHCINAEKEWLVYLAVNWFHLCCNWSPQIPEI